MRFIHPQTTFRAGRLAPHLYGQIESREYFEGLSICDNALPSKQGGVFKRYGSQNVMALPLFGTDAKIITVTLFVNKSYHLVFTDELLYVLDIHGHTMAISPPFTFLAGQTLDPSLFSVACFENTVFITHYSGELRPITVKFTSEVTAFIDQIPVGSIWNVPFNDANIDSSKRIRVKNVANVNALQLETNFSLFSANMVGEYIRITGLTNYVPKDTTLKSAEKVIQTDIFQITSYVSPTLVNVASAQQITLKAEPIGGGVAVEGTFCVFANFNAADELVSNDSLWFEEWNDLAWNIRYGWPRTVVVDESRLIFGGTKEKPSTLYGSKTANPYFFMDKRFYYSINVTPYFSYSNDIVETDPFQFTIATKLAANITFMESGVSFIVGTGRQEFIVSGNGQGISKKNISIRPHTSHGSAPMLSAASDNTIFYVGRTREQIFLFKYNESNGSYISKEVSILNPDIFAKKIKQIEWHEELSILMVVLDTNELVTITHVEETQTLALGEHTFPFEIIDVSYAIGTDDDDYGVLLAKKDGKLFIEYLDRRALSFLPPPMASLAKKLPHGDNLKIINTFSTKYIKYIDAINNVINVDRTSYVVGQEVVFTSTNVNALSGTGLALSTPYYAIPFANADISGIRLALTKNNADNNIFINIALDVFFDNPTFSLRMDSSRIGLTTINVEHLPVGQSMTIFHDNGDVLNTVEYTRPNSNTEFDLGVEASVYAMGQAFKMMIATMPIEAGQQFGSAQLGIKRLDNVGIRFYDSLSFKVSTDGYNEEEVVYNEFTTGRHDLAITANSELDQRVYITNDKIEPCYINNLAMRGVTNDG